MSVFLIMGEHKLPQGDGKSDGDKEFIAREVPTTFFVAPFFWEYFLWPGMGLSKDKDGNLSVALPMGNAKLPGIASQDIGKCAYGIFK